MRKCKLLGGICWRPYILPKMLQTNKHKQAERWKDMREVHESEFVIPNVLWFILHPGSSMVYKHKCQFIGYSLGTLFHFLSTLAGSKLS